MSGLGKTMRSKFFWVVIKSALLVPIVAALIIVNNVCPSFANVRIPVDEVIQELQGVRVPLLVPESLPITAEERIYWSANTTPTGCQLS